MEPNPAGDFREHLYTIDSKGNRLWVYPHVIQGFYRNRRILIAVLLIMLYLALPWITVSGKQAVFLNLLAREFTFFGFTFFASDTEFLVVLLGGMGFLLFFFTAVFGRVWCGWACPETVFLEFIFRPIEALCEGSAAQRLRADNGPWSLQRTVRKAAKWLLFALMAWCLATTAITYFVGKHHMWALITGSPLLHPGLFTLTIVVMGLMLFQFGWFREQFCTVLCPYARFQSVLMDNKSLIVGYDSARGEPRGKKTGGDCIDCKLCVRVCPTGIDIRNGLQLECIQCTACADACDSIMESIGKPVGLVRYTTEEKLAGRQHSLLKRPRVLVYAAILALYAIIFISMLVEKPDAEVRLLRKFAGDSPYSLTPDGSVMNHLEAHITNKSTKPMIFHALPSPDPRVTFISPLTSLTVPPGALNTLPLFLVFESAERPASVTVRIGADGGYETSEEIILVGPDL